ncbi:uncharacterized protein [Anabrus simplex]|uniref:uncharacterized protein n=1 Tax=Anabrus simplex TaxID=316456 RepID=UPI0034DDC5B1
MFSRTMRPVIRSLSRYGESASAQVRAYHEPAHFKPGTMSDLPVPQGSWEAEYSAQQRKYNLHLVIGVAFTALTAVVAANSGLVVLNSSVPKLKE